MMDSEKLISLGSRILFYLSVLLLFIAVVERLANIAGYTFLRQTYTPGRLLEFAAVFMIFVMVILLRQIREELRHPKTN